MSGVDLLQVAPPDRIAEFLGHGVSGDLVKRLMEQPSLRRSLSQLLERRLSSHASDERQKVVLAMDIDGVTELAAHAGIVWHSSSIAGVIDATARRDLVAQIGEDRYRLALAAHREMCPAPHIGDGVTTIASAVAHEGMGCLAAWRANQPNPFAARLRLYWPNTTTTPAHRAFGPGIVDWLLARRAA